MKQRVLVVAAGWDQLPIIREAQRLGHFVVAVDGNPQACGLREADAAEVVSTRDVEGVLRTAEDYSVDAITSMITESPLEAIHLAATQLGLPAPSRLSIEATISKIRMREIFAAAGISDVRFGCARTSAEAKRIAAEIGFPLVMKSADVGGQLGLFRIEDPDDVEAAFADARQHSVEGAVIFEELLLGPELNVVAVILDGKIRALTASDRIKHPREAFGIVQRHLYPAACDPAEHAAVVELCQQAVTALEIRNAIIFPQLILTPSGPRLVETGERIPGGVMKELFELATGIDLVRLQLDIAFGAVGLLEDYCGRPKHAAVTVKFLTARPGPLLPGRVATVHGRQAALSIPGVVETQFYNNPQQPQEIRPLRNARDRFYFVIAVGNQRDEVVLATDRATELLDFRAPDERSLIERVTRAA